MQELHKQFESRMLAKVRGAPWSETSSHLPTQAQGNGRRPIVWEDAFEAIPTVLGKDAVVEVWDDQRVLEKALVAGNDAILALGWSVLAK